MRQTLAWMPAVLIVAGTALQAEVPPLPAAQRLRVAEARPFTVPEQDPMRMPTDVAVDREGQIYVADGVNSRVVIFSNQGSWAGTIDRIGERSLADPVGLTVDNRNRLWITDTGRAALIVLDESARQTKQGDRWIDLPRTPAGRPCDPTDVAIAPDGERIWLVDNDHHRLMFREGEEGAWSVMGGPGTGPGQFQWPFMLAVGPAGDLYLTEAIGARVQHLTANLRWSGQIGRWGIRPGELYRPKGVVVDGDGRVYVSDSTMGVVQVFRPDGRLVGVLSGEDGRPYRFAHPMGMAFDAKADLFVVEMKRDTVTKVTLAQSPATQPAGQSEQEEQVK